MARALFVTCLGIQTASALTLPFVGRRVDPLPSRATCSRRDVFGVGVAALAVVSHPGAATAAQDVNDLSRLKKGLDSVQFLLDNWSTETVDPVSGADSPDRVRFALGLRTTDHPLFQVDKLLQKAQMKLPDDVDIEDWSKDAALQHVSAINDDQRGCGSSHPAMLQLTRSRG